MVYRLVIFGAARIALGVALLVAMSGESGTARAPREVDRNRLAAVLQKDLDRYVADRAKIEHLSSLSLCVSLGRRQTPIAVTSGTVRFRGGPRVTATTLYQIGSNTKAFTAVAVLQLEAQGRLSIDAPIGTYLPQYPAYARLTLRRLLSMTSGLESYDNLPVWERRYASDPHAKTSADTLIRLVYPQIKFMPGSKYHYSNTGYLLAQKVVDARSASGSFATEIARIERTAGLENTFYTSHLYAPSIARRVTAGYFEQEDPGLRKLVGKDVSDYSLSWAQGAGSIVSTPGDLSSWVRVLYQSSKLLPKKQQEELISLVSVKTGKPLRAPSAGDPSGFGLGVAEVFNPKLGTYWFYQGETLGFRAVHLYFPTSDLVVSIFANSRPREKDSHLQQLFSTLYASIEGARAEN